MTRNKSIRKEDLSEKREYHTQSTGIFFKVKNLLYKQNSPYQKIEVFENEYFGNVLLLDDLVQTTERDEFFYHEMLVHPSLITHPDPLDLLIIGGGDGGVLKETLKYHIKNVCLVEIDPHVIEVSKKYFPWLSPCLKDQRTELVIADGKKFIEKIDRKFDIILIDSSDPVGPSASLHQKRFYEKLKNCLNNEGIVVAQVGSPLYNSELIREKSASLKELYKIVSFYVIPVPTYPGGSWCFVYLSDNAHPLSIKRDPPLGLNYFNLETHRSAFSLPNFLKEKSE
ncbi:MAG: polyamine aminopropyltransferase [Candidatus Heimdallarchaeota archaeon]|nr:MAG: polyamine aminopropyltransferase [Candidatus Aminicenantes bacterium]UCG02033.1 MAG: polyamine aminopropyltransferase [Candidatus Heimdallarchaeota archaeon]